MKVERQVLKLQAKKAVQNVIKGVGSFMDVVIITQNQIIDEFQYVANNEKGLAQTILYMTKNN
tara:strand:- start:1124 stop:1312 length:189 start_codon:yes stop_codon:yes gene_type:complete